MAIRSCLGWRSTGAARRVDVVRRGFQPREIDVQNPQRAHRHAFRQARYDADDMRAVKRSSPLLERRQSPHVFPRTKGDRLRAHSDQDA